VTPVTRPEIEDAAGDKGEGDGIGARHPLAVLCDLAIARGDERGGGADHPGDGLHGGSGKAGTAGCESDSGERTNEHGDDVDAAENAMELEMTLADARREIDGAD